MGSSSLLSSLGLRAELEPLHGKYYGSTVTLRGSDGSQVESFQVWVMGDYTPSERELDGWDENEHGPYEINDSHYESALGYEICKLIVGAINGE